MTVMEYPGLDQVENEGTKSALRLVWDEIRTLDEREEARVVVEDAGISDKDLSTIQAALQQGGSNQLDVGGLAGLLQGMQKAKTIQFGLWAQSANTPGVGPWTVVWDREVLVSARELFRIVDVFDTSGGGANVPMGALRFMASGTYLIHVQVRCQGAGNGVALLCYYNKATHINLANVNWAIISAGDPNTDTTHTLSLTQIRKIKAGDFVAFTTRTSYSRGDAELLDTVLWAIRLV